MEKSPAAVPGFLFTDGRTLASSPPLTAAHHPLDGQRIRVDKQQIRIQPHSYRPLACQPQGPRRIGRDRPEGDLERHPEGAGADALLPQAGNLAAAQLDEAPLAIETRQAGIGIGAEADALGEHPDGQQ